MRQHTMAKAGYCCDCVTPRSRTGCAPTEVATCLPESALRHLHPAFAGTDLQRAEAPLVVHLRVTRDPETQVHPRQATALGQGHLLQDGVGAQASGGFVRIVE